MFIGKQSERNNNNKKKYKCGGLHGNIGNKRKKLKNTGGFVKYRKYI